LFFLHKTSDVIGGCKRRSGYNDFRVIANLKRHGFLSFSASPDRVGNVHQTPLLSADMIDARYV